MAVLLLLAILSATVVTGYASDVKTHKGSIAQLDEKRNTVLKLTAGAASVSTAITIIPGDIATPIAQELAKLEGKFMIVLVAIFLEKYLLTLSGYIVFRWLIPLALIGYGAGHMTGWEPVKKMAVKIGIFGIVLYMMVPVSVKFSSMIEKTYRESIETTIHEAEKTADELQETTGEAEEVKEKKGFLSGMISRVQEGSQALCREFEKALNRFIEALAVFIVTNCLLPIGVFAFFFWILKMIFQVDVHTPELRIPRYDSLGRKKEEQGEE